MTSKEFVQWLRGYIDAKHDVSLHNEDKSKILEKMDTINDPVDFNPIVPLHPTPTPAVPMPPYYPDVWYTTSTDDSMQTLSDEMDKKDIE
jgi:hypothetical protein